MEGRQRRSLLHPEPTPPPQDTKLQHKEEVNTRLGRGKLPLTHTCEFTWWEMKLVEKLEFLSHISMIHPTCTGNRLRGPELRQNRPPPPDTREQTGPTHSGQ